MIARELAGSARRLHDAAPPSHPGLRGDAILMSAKRFCTILLPFLVAAAVLPAQETPPKPPPEVVKEPAKEPAKEPEKTPPAQPTPPQEPAPAAPAAPAATPPKELSIDDALSLPRRLVRESEKFLGWLDAQQFLVSSVVEVQGQRPRTEVFRVHVGSGEKAPHVDHEKVAAALAALPGFDAREAQRLARDVGNFTWSRDKRAILWNTADDLLHVDLTNHRATRLTNGPDEEIGAQFSPDGRMVAYVSDFDLHVVGVDGGSERALTAGGSRKLMYGRLDWIYQEELYGRGNFQGYWWSPDSTRIALLRFDQSEVPDFTLVSDTPTRPNVEVASYPKAGDPNPKVSVGVVAVRGGDLRWFDLSRYGTQDVLIVRVGWHPDGSEVYLQVQDREQRWLELLAGDPRNGQVRLVLREESPTWVEVDAEPFWIDDGKSFLWLSERDGWKHLWHYQRDGKEIARLTKGDFEVTEIAGFDAQARIVYFLSDSDSIREKHLWRCGIDGNGAARVTRTPGVHSVQLSPDASLFVDTLTAVDLVRRIDLRRMDDAVVRTFADSDMAQLAQYQLPAVEFVQIPARDGFVMEGMLIKPRGFQAGTRYPVVQFAYAGPHAPQVRNRFGSGRQLWHQLLAAKGYAVFVVDNRTASGKGRKSADACFKQMGVTELQDLEDAAEWLVQQGIADPTRLALWGWSYGGYQTAYCMTRSQKWKVGMAVNPVTDWRLYDSIYTERYMGLPQTNPNGYRTSSVLAGAAGLQGRLLLVAGAMDDNVHMQNTLQLAHALQLAGKQFDLMVYPRVRHGIENERQQAHLYTLMTEFLGRHL